MVYYLSLVSVVVPTLGVWGWVAWRCPHPVGQVVVIALMLAMIAEVAYDVYLRRAEAEASAPWEEQIRTGGRVRFTAEGGFYLDQPDGHRGDTGRRDGRRGG